ncbi:hypothetical protein [Chitinophaga sp.]|uniref:hypothetical protein n=1 Tax=Chitinophaga sp. TaxID=1869181 RepID=UPI0031D39571
MVKYLVIIVILNVFQPGIEGVYTKSIQEASFVESVNKRWELTIKNDSSFNYTIHERFPSSNLDSTYRATGKWDLIHDTLILKTYTYPYLFEFVVKGDRLIPIADKPVRRGSLIIKLDYLSRDPS